jgi:hypothetical protein
VDLAEPVGVIALHPQAQANYLRIVDDLAAAIRDRKPGTEIANSIRELIETVTVTKTEPGESLKIEVQGKLAALIEAPVFPTGSLSGVKVVAGERYSMYPPTWSPDFPDGVFGELGHWPGTCRASDLC